MDFPNDIIKDYELQFYNCYVCNDKISEYFLQKFNDKVEKVCPYCFDLEKEYKRTSKLLKEVGK